MAFVLERHGFQFPFTAASSMPPFTPVKLSASSALTVVPIATAAEEPWAVTGAGTALQGEQVTVYEAGNIVKMKAAGSLGPNADVYVSSTNGAVGASGAITASGHWFVGKNLSIASAAGEIVSVYIKPKKA